MRIIEEHIKAICDKYDKCYNEDEPFSATNHPNRLYMLLSIAEVKLPFPQSCPVSIKNSNYGRGLFANRDISNGEIVCIYPCHSIVYKSNSEKSICISLEDDLPDISYAFELDKDICIYGSPNMYMNEWFSGHLANDLCYDSNELKDNPTDLDAGQWICKYDLNMVNRANVKYDTFMYRHYKFCFLKAIRYIPSGEEISVPYRQSYWLSKKGRKGVSKDELTELSYKYLLTKPVSYVKFYDSMTRKIKV